jgi:phosphatidylethanolamine-binding protein
MATSFPSETSSQPKFFLSPNSTNLPIRKTETFVITIVDPDAPTPQDPSASQYLHYIGSGFTVASKSTTSPQLVSSKDALVEFAPPSPPSGSDPHRYATPFLSYLPTLPTRSDTSTVM